MIFMMHLINLFTFADIFANIVLILTLQVDQGWSAQKRWAEVLEETGSKDLSVSKQTNKLWRFMKAKP